MVVVVVVQLIFTVKILQQKSAFSHLIHLYYPKHIWNACSRWLWRWLKVTGITFIR